MTTLHSKFTEHPNSVGETYFQHLATASFFASRLLMAAVVCSIHALLPFLFVKTGSRLIDELHTRMVTARHRSASNQSESQSLPHSVNLGPQTR